MKTSGRSAKPHQFTRKSEAKNVGMSWRVAVCSNGLKRQEPHLFVRYGLW